MKATRKTTCLRGARGGRTGNGARFASAAFAAIAAFAAFASVASFAQGAFEASPLKSARESSEASTEAVFPTSAQIAERWNAGEISDREAFELAQASAARQVATIDETFPIVEATPEPSEESRRLYREGRALRYGLNGRFVDRKRGLELLEQAAEAGSLNAMAEAALAYWGESAMTSQYRREAYDCATAPARLGHPFAQLVLAKYFKQEGVDWDLAKSKECYAKAAAGLKRWAEAGDPMAASLLAGLYADGNGVEKNAEEAERWHKRAVEKECAVATRNFSAWLTSNNCAQEGIEMLRRAAAANLAYAWEVWGSIYQEGDGVVKNEAEAVACWERAFELGRHSAAGFLVFFYESKQDLQNMYLWSRKAADTGCSKGFILLGICYWLGRGVEKDIEKAEEYFEKAAELGDPYGLLGLGEQAQITGDFDAAVSYFRRAADRGNTNALIALGRCCELGRGVQKDSARAFEYYLKAAEAGDELALVLVGKAYLNGTDVEQNYEKALEYLQKAKELGSTSAQVLLGSLYLFGNGVEKDVAEALKLFQKSAELGDYDAMYYLGYLYAEGLGVEKDLEKANEWYRKGALRSVEAITALGWHYENGLGVEQDYQKAVELYREADRWGSAQGTLNLGLCYEKGRGVEQSYKKANEYYRKAAGLGASWGMFNLALN